MPPRSQRGEPQRMPATPSIEFFVSPLGSDRWSGRLAEPNADRTDGSFASLEAARDAIRAVKDSDGLPAGGITVWLGEGAYCRTHAFELSGADSGTVDAPIRYRARPGQEARLAGGREIVGFERVTEEAIRQRLCPAARGHVHVCDLRAQGIDDFGELRRRGFAPVHTAALELFLDDQPMTLARWPNEGWLHIDTLPEGERIPPPHILAPADRAVAGFVYLGNRPQRWAGLDDVWVHGFWAFDYANCYEPVASIDPETGVIRTQPSSLGATSTSLSTTSCTTSAPRPAMSVGCTPATIGPSGAP